MMTVPPRWFHARSLVRAACILGLVALLSTALGILFPYALPVVLSMSLGHGVGALAFVSYLLAIVAEALQRQPAGRESAPDSARPRV